MDKQEKQISFFNSYFVCKKVHHVSQPVKLIDAIIDEEDTILMSEIAKDIDSNEKQGEENVDSEEEKEMKEKLSIEDPFSIVDSDSSSYHPGSNYSVEEDSNSSIPYAPNSNSNDELPTKITIKKTKKTTKKKQLKQHVLVVTTDFLKKSIDFYRCLMLF